MSKSSIFIFLIFVTVNIVFSQNNPSYYVWAKSGLSLREQPNSSSKKITVIPFGTKLPEIEYIDNYNTSDSVLIFTNPLNKKQKAFIYGNWQEVTYHGKKGFVFDGYLSSFVPSSRKIDDLEEYINLNYKKLDSIYESRYQVNQMTFYKGCTIKKDHFEGGGDTYFYFYDKRFNDGYLLMNHFNEFPNYDGIKVEFQLDILITKDEIYIEDHDGADVRKLISFQNGALVLMLGAND